MIASPPTGKRSLVLSGVLVLALAGCTGSSASTGAPTSAAASEVALATPALTAATGSSATPAAASSPDAVASEGATPVPTDIDPCLLVTKEEASTLSGATLAAGTSTTLPNNDRMCSYGAQGIVVQVLVVVAPDAATAKAQEPDFKATLEQGVAQAGIVGAKLTELPDFEAGVDAAMVEGSTTVSGMKLAAIGFYALKGAVLVAISDINLGSAAASATTMQAQAHTSLARLP